MSDRIISHGIDFIRCGSCKRCGACEKPSCPHLTWEDGLATCKTYGKGDYLEWNCHVFPNSPFCDVILDGICAYTFEPVTEDGTRMYEEILAGVKQRRLERLSK
jgi:hypothetical protein